MSEADFNKIFSQRLKYYMDKNDINQVELSRLLRVSATTVSDWVRGRKTPRMDKVDKMCVIFNCHRSDLINDPNDDGAQYYINPETAKIAQEIYEDPDLHALFDAARDSDPEDMQMAADLLRRLKKTNPDG